jgi:hypothetical protein
MLPVFIVLYTLGLLLTVYLLKHSDSKTVKDITVTNSLSPALLFWPITWCILALNFLEEYIKKSHN